MDNIDCISINTEFITNKHDFVYGESSSNARDAPDVCLSFVLLFAIFIIVVTQKPVLQQSKNATAKCTETISPPPSIQFSLVVNILCSYTFSTIKGLFSGNILVENHTEMEFKEFEPRFKSAKTRFKLSAGLNL